MNEVGAITFETCSGPSPLFFKVTVLVPLVVPSSWDPKATLAGASETTGAVANPVSATVCVAPALPESSAIVSDPFVVPVTAGANVTETVQFDPAGSMAGQFGVAVNPLLTETLPKFSGLPPKLAIVTSWDEVLPTF